MQPVPPRASSHAAIAWWLVDSLLAGIFAAGLAFSVASLVEGEWTRAAIAACAMGMSGPARAMAQIAATDAGSISSMGARAALRHRLWPALLQTALFRARPMGEDMHLAIDTVETLEAYHARYMPLRAAAVVAPLLVVAMVALASPVSAILLFLTLVPFALGMYLAGSAAARAADRQLATLTRLSGLFVDRVRALGEIRLFGAEERIGRQIGAASADAAQRTLSVMRIAFVSSSIIDFFAAISVALVAVYCGFNLLGLLPFPVPEKLTLAPAFFALALAPEVYLPLRRLAAAYHDRQVGEAALTAIDTEAPAQPAPPALTDRFEGLVVHRLCVRPGSNGPVIGPLSLTLGGTGLHALVGPTGSGKSTILHAIAGLVPHCGGDIGWVAGAPAPIGWAGQRVLLLPGTLGQAIALARPDANMAEIEAAAHAAGLGPLLSARGLATWLDHRGSGLSGGERRRIGLARAILSNRPLLLLDEPTADLDRLTADRIIDTIQKLARDRCILVATHDDQLITRAGRVFSLP